MLTYFLRLLRMLEPKWQIKLFRKWWVLLKHNVLLVHMSTLREDLITLKYICFHLFHQILLREQLPLIWILIQVVIFLVEYIVAILGFLLSQTHLWLFLHKWLLIVRYSLKMYRWAHIRILTIWSNHFLESLLVLLHELIALPLAKFEGRGCAVVLLWVGGGWQVKVASSCFFVLS